MQAKEELVSQIVAAELAMFLTVPADGPYSCRQDPEGFRLHRAVQFTIWSADTLEAYLNDLRQAGQAGINLMTVKYARMGNRIARTNYNPLIDAIAAIQLRWQKEMIRKYPALMAAARPLEESADSAVATSFETYLRGELETYSDSTLSLLHRDLHRLEATGQNGSEAIYTRLVLKLGFGSLADAEQQQAARAMNNRK